MIPERKSIFFCFCGPGASGKSTLCSELVKREKNLRLSISTTTRQPRGEEKDGQDYYFVSDEEFLKRVSAGRFIEHAVFNGKRYGTEKTVLEIAEREGEDVLLDIDIQGVEQLKKLFADQTVTVFVFPPSFAVLEERIRGRGTETEENIRARLKIAKDEVAKLRSAGFSDFLLINDDLERAHSGAHAIIKAERYRFHRYPETMLQKMFRSSNE